MAQDMGLKGITLLRRNSRASPTLPDDWDDQPDEQALITLGVPRAAVRRAPVARRFSANNVIVWCTPGWTRIHQIVTLH